ncbi:Fic family protein [Candidatus Saccharibacteria bacterium]|nr:Fic family protein [Candidatus Saccharibacteria bacterium]
MITDKFTLTRADNIFVAKKYLKDSVYRSAFLEGIAVTFPQTEAILENAAVSGVSPKDVSKVFGLRDGWQYILNNLDTPVTLRTQPFLDGNKRVGTLVGNLLLVSYGRGIFSLPPDLKPPFTEQLVAFYESGIPDTLKDFIWEYCLTGL